MKTSVVMATFNGEAYLPAQLDSLTAQTLLPDELIVADDGSSDRTTEILEDFAFSAPFKTKILRRTRRMGYANNFADAALHARGDVLLFCDQDDWWEKDKVRKITEYFDCHPEVELVTHNISVCDEHLQPRIKDYFEYFKENSYHRLLFIKGCATAIRRSLRNRAFPLPLGGRWTHDGRVHSLAHMNNSSGFIEDRLVLHRIHSHNASGYIIQKKTGVGALLAKLDARAIESSGQYRRALLHFPAPPIDEQELTEFLSAHEKCFPPDWNEAARNRFRLTAQAVNERSRVARLRPKPLTAMGFLFLMMKGGYKVNGSAYAFIADIMRLVKFGS